MDVVFAFDVDGVLLAPRSSWSVMHNFFGIDNTENVVKFREGKITYDEFVDLDLKLLLGKCSSITYDKFDQIKKLLNPNPNHQVLNDFLKTVSGKKIAISGGIDLLVERVKEFYPIEEIHSNRLLFSQGKLVGSSAEVSPEMKGKILSRYKGKKISVGDSKFDESMFKVSDYSILFNSEDDVDVDYVIRSNDLSELTKVLREIYYG